MNERRRTRSQAQEGIAVAAIPSCTASVIEPPKATHVFLTEKVLRDRGFSAEGDAVAAIRKRDTWSAYVVALVKNVQAAMRKHMTTGKLRFLLYPSRLRPEHEAQLRRNGAGVIWL